MHEIKQHPCPLDAYIVYYVCTCRPAGRVNTPRRIHPPIPLLSTAHILTEQWRSGCSLWNMYGSHDRAHQPCPSERGRGVKYVQKTQRGLAAVRSTYIHVGTPYEPFGFKETPSHHITTNNRSGPSLRPPARSQPTKPDYTIY